MIRIIYSGLCFVLICTAGADNSRRAEASNDNGFVQPLDFSPIFQSSDSGLISLASNPVSAAILKVDKSQYPQLFDSLVSSSIDSLQPQVAASEKIFSSESFGFKPIASQGFLPPPRPAQLVAKPQRYQTHLLDVGRSQPLTQPAAAQQRPLQYDIQQVHDANYKVYKPEDEPEGEEILSALKKNPSVAAYFKPPTTKVEIAHPVKYRNEELAEDVNEQNYKPNPYLPGPARIRRYSDGRRSERLKQRRNSDEDDFYDYKSDYTSRPKAFDSGPYSSAYKEDKNKKNDYEYPYDYDSGYDHKEYERIKELSEKQAAEIKQNPGNCKEVKKDDMTCTICKDPKTGGNYESCSYVAEPKNNKYAYSKERKFDSNDEPDEPEKEAEGNAKSQKSAKYEDPKQQVESSDGSDTYSPQKGYAKLTASESKPYQGYRKEPQSGESDGKYKAYYVHTSKPKGSAALRAAEDEDSNEKSDSLTKPYNYKSALPGFYTDNEPKKDVEHVLAEFRKKDRSSCNKVQKNEAGNEGAESKVVATTAASPVAKSAAYVVAPNGYGKKLKRKKVAQNTASTAATNIVASVVPAGQAAPAATPTLAARKAKRSEQSEAEADVKIVDETNVAPPEDFAGADSKGAFWAETVPRYSATLGVTLPEFMLARSEHEDSFDETVAGA
ncbi:hypothetical protein EVAR_59836_1 [Eumeta japonica]|uniref:Uncharacterized protein n=1 Tax=Eumeta variegata TaxID=151549 RepID=A0A4C1Z4Z2_EUMVA|nr:hypothetical protein EVAR_59836_1 [Eumeta japonica]